MSQTESQPKITKEEIWASEINAFKAIQGMKRALEYSLGQIEGALRDFEECKHIAPGIKVNYLDQAYTTMKDLIHDYSELRPEQNYCIVEYLRDMKKFQELAEKYSTQLMETA